VQTGGWTSGLQPVTESDLASVSGRW